MPASSGTSGVRPGERYRDLLAGRRQPSSSGRLGELCFGFLMRPRRIIRQASTRFLRARVFPGRCRLGTRIRRGDG